VADEAALPEPSIALDDRKPGSMAIDPETHTIYVVTRRGVGGDSTIDVVDPARGDVAATIPSVTNASAVAIAPDRHELYVANYALRTVSVVDTRTRAVTATIPVGKEPWAVRADPSAPTLYVMTGDEFTVIDADRRVVTSNFRIDNEFPEISRGFAVIAGRLYVPIPIAGEHDWVEGKVAVVDIATGGVITEITVGRSPDLVLDPAGPTIYVVNRYDETISVIDPATGTVTGPYPVDFEGGGDSAIDPARQTLYITNFSSDTVSEIDLESMELVRTHRVGDAPRSPVVDPATHHVYTSDSHSHSISVIEPAEAPH